MQPDWKVMDIVSLPITLSSLIKQDILGGGGFCCYCCWMLKVKVIKTVTLTLLNMSLLKGVLKDYPKLPWGLVHHGECLEAMTGIWGTGVLWSLNLTAKYSSFSWQQCGICCSGQRSRQNWQHCYEEIFCPKRLSSELFKDDTLYYNSQPLCSFILQSSVKTW